MEIPFDTGSISGKRKRGGMKSMSVTPSINDDEDEERDMVSFCHENPLMCVLMEWYVW